VLVAVYYEALCPDSKNFIVKQLKSAYTKIPNLIEIEFFPYGKASTHENADGTTDNFILCDNA
jgi:interferon, gamma-inducible protein 30